MGDAQSRGLNNLRGRRAGVFDQDQFMIETLGVPHRHLQPQRLAQQSLPGTEFLRRSRTPLSVRIVQQHLRQTRRPADFIDPRIGRFDQHRIARPLRTEVQRITATGVIHIDVSAIQKQSLTLFRVAERGMAAFFRAVIGFGFDDPRAQPQTANAMANDFAEQILGEDLCVTVEKSVGKPRRLALGAGANSQVGHGKRCLSGLMRS